MENYPDFEKMAHVIQHGLQGLYLKIATVSQRRQTDLSHILHKWACCKNNFKVANVFSKLNPSRAFGTTAQINEELKIMEFDGAFCKKIKLLIDRFCSIFLKRR